MAIPLYNKKIQFFIICQLYICDIIHLSFSKNAEKSDSFIKINFHSIDESIQQVQYCENTQNRIYSIIILTDKGQILKSENAGENWENITISLQLEINSSFASDEKNSIVKKVIASPIDQNILIFQGNASINWITEDCGRNIRIMRIGQIPIQKIEFVQNQRQSMYGSVNMACPASKMQETKIGLFNEFEDVLNQNVKNNQTQQQCGLNTLYYSPDLGNTWRQILTNVIDFKIEQAACHTIGIIDRVYALVIHQQASLSQNTENNDLIFSDDMFQSKKIISLNVEQAFFVESGILITKFDNKNKLTLLFLVPCNAIQEHSLKIINFSESLLQFKNIFIVEQSNESLKVFVDRIQLQTVINSEIIKYSIGNIYNIDVSQPQSLSQSKYEQNSINSDLWLINALQLMSRKTENETHQKIQESADSVQFKQINGIFGHYIANVIEEQYLDGIFAQIQSENETQYNNINNKIQTVLTIDNGKIWKNLNAPTSGTISAQQQKCPDCHLHLHLLQPIEMQQYDNNNKQNNFFIQSMFSNQNCLGLLIANGNIGEYLFIDDSLAQSDTFLSNDAGLTWQLIQEGPATFSASDHAGIIVIQSSFKHANNTTQMIKYSTNYGKSFDDLNLELKMDFELKQILTNLKHSSQKFFIIGQQNEDSYQQHQIIISVDFSKFYYKSCTLPRNRQDLVKSDYSLWSFQDESKPCQNGLQPFYLRKKADSQCFLDHQSLEDELVFMSPFYFESCPCTESDWECLPGYDFSDRNQSCQALMLSDANQILPNVNLTKLKLSCLVDFNISSGIAKKPGNQCQKGVQFDESIVVDCPNKTLLQKMEENKHKRAICIILLLILAALYYKYNMSNDAEADSNLNKIISNGQIINIKQFQNGKQIRYFSQNANNFINFGIGADNVNEIGLNKNEEEECVMMINSFNPTEETNNSSILNADQSQIQLQQIKQQY